MKKAFAISAGTLVYFAIPLISFAAINNISDVGSFIINLINNVAVPVLFALAFIVFLWGAFNAFIIGSQNDTAKEKGKNLMIWGLIGFFVMVSVWGLVNILASTFNFGINTGPSSVPTSGVQLGS